MSCEHPQCPEGNCLVLEEATREWAIHEAAIAPGRAAVEREEDLFHEVLRTVRADCPSMVLYYHVDDLMREAERRGLLTLVRSNMLGNHTTPQDTKFRIRHWRGAPLAA